MFQVVTATVQYNPQGRAIGTADKFFGPFSSRAVAREFARMMGLESFQVLAV